MSEWKLLGSMNVQIKTYFSLDVLKHCENRWLPDWFWSDFRVFTFSEIEKDSLQVVVKSPN